MKKKKLKCETCRFRGYSPNFCQLHSKKITGEDSDNCDSHRSLKCVGKTVAIGAGIGATATVIGVAAAPALGLKAAISHALGAKLAAGGAAGAGVNVARKAVKGKENTKQKSKKRTLLPLYLKGS